MTLRAFGLMVKKFPETLHLKQGRCFLSDLQSHMNSDRPYIVLDFSNVGRMDRSGIHLLLCCLEEALKRNGDVKLAAVPEETKAILKLTGVDQLFEIFDTSAEAVGSFRRFPLGVASHVGGPGSLYRASADAA